MKVKLQLPPDLYMTALSSKKYTLLMLHFQMGNVLKCSQNSFVLVSCLLYLKGKKVNANIALPGDLHL